MHITSKKALVIGGSRGIGAAIVEKLAAEGFGVEFSYSGSPDAATALADRTRSGAIRSDAADRDAVIRLVRDSGPLDLLVVNAGIFVHGDPLELDPDEIDRMIDINIRAPYFAAVEAARTMPDGGRIILIGSTNANRVPFAGMAAYTFTKSALQGMVTGLARDFGPRDITVNVVQPGPTDTDMNPAAGPMASMMHDMMALKRHGTAADVASYVAFLAGPNAGGITGSMQTIDGGFAA